jgi:hypothetical protein
VSAPQSTTYAERLWPPLGGSLVAVALAASLGVAFGAPLGVAWGLAVLLVAETVVAVGWLRSAAVLRVDADGFAAGRAVLPHEAVGTVTPLDAEQARELRGTGADSRAFMLLRGWIATALRVDVNDPNDPTPYWYVSTRRPQELAQALEAVKPH